MKITDIKQQQRRTDRYSIYVDGKYAFSLGESALLDMGIKLGQEFADGELAKLKAAAGFDKLYDSALGYISIRQRSVWELERYLRRKQAEPDEADQVIKRLLQRKWLDDLAFANAWVNNRRQLKATSLRRLRQELMAKKVNSEIIDQVLAADPTDEQAVLRQLVERKRQMTRYKDDLKLMQYLVRQGFSYDDVKQAVRQSGSGEEVND